MAQTAGDSVNVRHHVAGQCGQGMSQPASPTHLAGWHAGCNETSRFSVLSRMSDTMRRKIILTADDFERLESLLASNLAHVAGNSGRLDELRAELDRARIVSRHEVPNDLVTMDSIVAVRDLETAEVETYTLVYPERADIAKQKLSVLAPIGTAILGYRVGDEFQWRVPEGSRRLRIDQVVFQPERDGIMHL